MANTTNKSQDPKQFLIPWAQNISPKTADQPLTIMEKIIEFFMIMLRLVSPFLKSIEDSVYYIK